MIGAPNSGNTMTKTLLTVSVTLLASASLAFGQAEAPAKPAAPAAQPAATAAAAMDYAVFYTNKGYIVIELDRAKAPISVENFESYIKDGFYNETVFHRVVPGFVIQGGGFSMEGAQKTTKKPIANEWQNGLKNKRGTLSMARTNDPNSATSQFFVSLKDNDSLDQPISGGAGYAVFGKVTSGMAIVDLIAASQCTTKHGMRDWPVQDVIVTKAELISKEKAEDLTKNAPVPIQGIPAATRPATTPATAPAAPGKAPAAPAAPAGAADAPKTKPGTPASPTP